MSDESFDHRVLGPVPQVALFIDTENVGNAKNIPLIMKEISSYGSIAYRRAYVGGNLKGLKKWSEVLQENAITPVLQLSQGKNASDAAMIIDAMDMLHSGRYDIFALITSDGDFTRLATRLRDDCKTVVGIGHMRASAASFMKACTSFVYMETLETLVVDPAKPTQVVAAPEMQQMMEAVLDAAIVEVAHKSGMDEWADLANVGTLVKSRASTFDVRALGYRCLNKYLSTQHSDKYELWREQLPGPQNNHRYWGPQNNYRYWVSYRYWVKKRIDPPPPEAGRKRRREEQPAQPELAAKKEKKAKKVEKVTNGSPAQLPAEAPPAKAKKGEAKAAKNKGKTKAAKRSKKGKKGKAAKK